MHGYRIAMTLLVGAALALISSETIHACSLSTNHRCVFDNDLPCNEPCIGTGWCAHCTSTSNHQRCYGPCYGEAEQWGCRDCDEFIVENGCGNKHHGTCVNGVCNKTGAAYDYCDYVDCSDNCQLNP